METMGKSGSFFAAMNTPEGFISYFPEIFGGIQRLYIIKGGPGTGKSRLMRELSAQAKEKGYETEEFLCSSDPTSLDGVIIKELSFAMIDGTSPHTYDPKIPGAKDNIIDLGQFWDRGKLEGEVKTISRITQRKTALYKMVYTYLSAEGDYGTAVTDIVEKCLETEKMKWAAKRLALRLGEGREVKHTVRIRSAISGSGRIVLPSFAQMAKHRYAVLDVCGSGGEFLSALLKETDAAGLDVTVSYDPMYPGRPDALYYETADTSFYIGSESDYEEKQINMRRFIDDDKLKPYKPTIRAAERNRKTAEKDMYNVFSGIKRLHTELERIYGTAMDFRSKEEFCKKLIKEIIK